MPTAAGRSIGFVPTMGYLHAGHQSLMQASVVANDITVVSIFVNPLQFAAGEDLGSYPRDLARDTDCCADAGVDLIFAPSVEEMYPGSMATIVDVASVAAPLEERPGPSISPGSPRWWPNSFRSWGSAGRTSERRTGSRSPSSPGWLLISMPVEVVPCPTMREPDGLAMSSRNVYLTSDERAEAPVLRRALDAGLAVIAEGETDPAVVEAVMADTVATASLAALDYVAAVQADTLIADGPLHGEVRLLVAVRFGTARLIDNDGGMVPGTPA